MTMPCRSARLWAALALLASLAAFALAHTPSAHAGDKASGRIDLEASLEPSDLAPGQEGVLVVKGTLLNKEHKIAHFVYAEGEKAMKYEGVEASGVTYHLDKKTITAPKDVKDFEEVHSAWQNEFTLRVPITLSKDVATGTEIGLRFSYYGCIVEFGCYAQIKDQAALVKLGSEGGATSGGGSAIDPVKGAPGVDPKLAIEPTTAQGGVEADHGGTVSLRWDAKQKAVIVTFTPVFMHHMYGPGVAPNKGVPISVEPVKAKGLTWGAVQLDDAPEHIDLAYEVVIPLERDESVKRAAVTVGFLACADDRCKEVFGPKELAITWPGAAKVDAPAAAAAAPKGDVVFPVIEGDTLGGDIGDAEDESSFVQRKMEESPILGLGFIFLFGLALAFTPCVLPIIPITVSVITGGNADIPKRRLSALLILYVLGLSLAFATLGTVAAAAGGSVSALFALSGVQWGIAILFILLAFSMIGVYELQPPSWLMNLQGGAQKRSGSLVGAFMFGVLGAIIASPCTAPAVAGMLIVTAKVGSLPLGFIMFFMLGLGMGAVFYAAGALNFLMRPGPWMVWIRYGFGVMLFGMALYYLYGKGLVNETTFWSIGMGVAALAAYGVYWHLTKKEGEEPGRARTRGLQVGATWVAVTVLIFFVAARTTGEWTKVKDRDHLVQLVKEANAEGKPVVVDFWATWCATCNSYDDLFESNEELNALFKRVRKLKVDVGNNENHKDIRDALGMVSQGQPYMVMIDREGRIRKAADITGWYGSGEDGVNKVKARLAVILGDDKDDKDDTPSDGDVKTGDSGASER